jgi:hypothetical protein
MKILKREWQVRNEKVRTVTVRPTVKSTSFGTYSLEQAAVEQAQRLANDANKTFRIVELQYVETDNISFVRPRGTAAEKFTQPDDGVELLPPNGDEPKPIE